MLPDGPYAALGVRADDIVTSVNGRGLGSPQAADGLWDVIRQAETLTVTLLRGGAPLVFTYRRVGPGPLAP